MITATVISHKDVLGKDLYYLKISNGTNDVLINVGVGTYNKVQDLSKQLELPLTHDLDNVKGKEVDKPQRKR